MATKKVAPPQDAPKIVPNEDSDALVEFGTQTTFPMSSWDDFAYGLAHTSKNGAKEHFVISPRPEAVPLDKLVEMRRRDGQTRSLLRLFTIPILACLKESEWVAPEDEDKAEEEVQFANDMFNLPPQAGGMTSSKYKIVKHLLLAILEGFSVMEEVRQIPTEGPLKNKVTLRKLAHRDSRTIRFLVDSNGGFNGVKQTAYRPGGEAFSVAIERDKCVYYACLTGDTRIPLLNGTNPTIRELAQRHDAGEQEFWVYSNKDGKVVPGRATRAWKTGTRETIEVKLDNGAVVRCTPDHLFMLRDGSYREAGSLAPGDSLMPLYRRYLQQDQRGGVYEQVKHPATGKWAWTHRLAAGLGAGVKGHAGGTAMTSHHRDHDRLNNDPSNLEVLSWNEHLAHHATEEGEWGERRRSGLQKYWADPANRAKQADVMRRTHAEGKMKPGTWSEERRAAQSARMRGVQSDAVKAGRNHKVVSVRPAGIEDVYDLSVEEYHNFAVESGVFVHNCNEEENPFYGVSMFESAWYHYEVKTKLYFIAHIAAQMAAVPGRIGHYPMGTGPVKRAEFQNALAKFAFNASLSLPAEFTVEPFQSNSGFDFVKLIDHHSHLQAKSVLMHFADNENRMVLIDNGSGDASADMYVQLLNSIMDDLAALFTTYLMPKYIDWNFGTGVYPIFRFGALTDSARDAIKELFTVAMTAGMLNSTPEFVREMEKKLATRLGLDINYEEIEKIEDEAAEQQALAAEEQAKIAEEQMKADQEAAAAGGAPAGPPKPGQKPGQPQEEPASPFGMTADQQQALDNLVGLANDLFAVRPMSGVVDDFLPDAVISE